MYILRTMCLVIVLGLSGMSGCGLAERFGAKGADTAEEQSATKPPDEKPKAITLSPEQERQYGITLAQAGPGKLITTIRVPGEVALNADRAAVIVPHLAGIVTEVRKNLGDSVSAGEVVAVIQSRELAAGASALLTAREKLSLAKDLYEREKVLRDKKISPEDDYLYAKQTLAGAEIEARSSEQQLLALGLSPEYVQALSQRDPGQFTRFEVVSPMAGTITEKHVVLGDSPQAGTALYSVADLSTVWIDFDVPAKDWAAVHTGQAVSLVREDNALRANAKIDYMSPMMEPETRASLARALLPNDDRAWQPGMFVTGYIETGAQDVALLVGKDAVQSVGGTPTVFVKTEAGYEAKTVEVGESSGEAVAIASGLEAGQSYVSTGAFVLKADMEKSAEEE